MTTMMRAIRAPSTPIASQGIFFASVLTSAPTRVVGALVGATDVVVLILFVDVDAGVVVVDVGAAVLDVELEVVGASLVLVVGPSAVVVVDFAAVVVVLASVVVVVGCLTVVVVSAPAAVDVVAGLMELAADPPVPLLQAATKPDNARATTTKTVTRARGAAMTCKGLVDTCSSGSDTASGGCPAHGSVQRRRTYG